MTTTKPIVLALMLVAGQAPGQAPRSVKKHEANLVGQLKNAKGVMDRVKVLRLLPGYGAEAAVPVIAPLLDEPDPLLRAEAAKALQMNPSAEAGKALTAALEKAKEPAWRVALLQVLAARREAGCVKAAAAFLGDANPQVVAAAAFAIARGGGAQAAMVLKAALAKAAPQAKGAVFNGYLDCADGLRAAGKTNESLAIYQQAWKSDVSNARVRGLLGLAAAQQSKAMPTVLEALKDRDSAIVAAGLRVIRERPANKAVAASCVAEMPKLTPAVQALAWYALARRGDASVLPAAMEAVKSDDVGVKRAALWVVGAFGDAACIPVALPLAANDEGLIQAEARRTLRRLHGEPVPKAMLELLPKSDPRTQIELMGALADTGAAQAVPKLLSLAGGAQDARVRLSAYAALHRLAGPDDVRALVELLLRESRPDEQRAATRAVAQVCIYGENPQKTADVLAGAIAKGDAKVKARLIPVLARVGVKAHLGLLEGIIKDAGNGEVATGAVRAVATFWPNGAAAGMLLGVVRSPAKDVDRVLALRGYIRMVNVPRDRPIDEKVRMCRQALAAAKTVGVKKLALGALGEVASREALHLAVGLLGDEALKEEAAIAAVRVAGGLWAVLAAPAHRDAIRSALLKALAAARNENTRRAARDVLARQDRDVRHMTAGKLHALMPTSPQATPDRRRKVLIYCRHEGEMHREGAVCGAVAFRLLGTQSGAYDPTVSDDPNMLDAKALARFDAVVFPGNSGRIYGPEPLAAQRRKNLVEFVKGGKGYVGTHSATGDLAGGGFADHPWELIPGLAVGYALRVEDPSSPLCKALSGTTVVLPYHEEIYQYGGATRDTLHVLLSLDLEKEMELGSRKDHDYPLAWVRRMGSGRVFYTGLGHSPKLYESPVLLRFLLAGVQYALGDLKATDDPSGPLPANATAHLNAPPPQPQGEGDETGFTSLFNGRDIAGWDGDANVWRVRDGAIDVQWAKDKPLRGRASLTLKGEPVGDFELRLAFRIPSATPAPWHHGKGLPGASAGVTFHSATVGLSHVVPGQMRYAALGRLYYGSHGQVRMGQKVTISPNGSAAWTGFLGNPNQLVRVYRPKKWNRCTVIARGGRAVLKINGVALCEVEDNSPQRVLQGPLGLTVRGVDAPFHAQFKNIRLRKVK